MSELRDDPRFQVLQAKLETHFMEFRPKQYAKLKAESALGEYLYDHAEQAWVQMKAALESGYNSAQADELVAEIQYLSDEDVEEEEEQEQIAVVDDWLQNRAQIKIVEPDE